MSDVTELSREDGLKRIKDERERARRQADRNAALNLKRGSRETDGTLQSSKLGSGEHALSSEGRDATEQGEPAAYGGRDSLNGQVNSVDNESNGSSGRVVATDERQAPEKPPVKPRGLVTRTSAKEAAERYLTPEEQALKAQKNAAQAQRMRDWWADRRKSQAAESTEKPIEKEKTRGAANRPFSQGEIETVRPELVHTLMDLSVLMDEAMRGTSRTKKEPHIWEMDREEAEAIAHVMLLHAKKSGKGAERIRSLIDSFAYVKVGAVLIPRFTGSVKFYVENGIGLLPARRKREKGGTIDV